MDRSSSVSASLLENSKQLLTYEQLSSWLGLSVSSLEKYVHRNEIPAVRISRKAIRFRVSDIEHWLQSKKIGESYGS